MPKKIVIIGPESTGKSKICEELARHYKTVWVKEYAREYLLSNGKAYTYNDLSIIAEGQIKNEDEISYALSENEMLFIDTDLQVMKVWSEFVFNTCDLKILNGIVHRKYDLYLLMNTDLPWEKDELREYPQPEIREQLYHHYLDTLVQQQIPFKIIVGTGKTRTVNAVNLIDEFFTTSV